MPDDIESRLVHATLAGNHALVKELLDSGADLELAGEAAARLLGGKPLLFALVFYGHGPGCGAGGAARDPRCIRIHHTHPSRRRH